MKNSLVVKFFIWFIASLLVLYIAKHMVGIYPPYERNIKTYGLVIIGINIIFGLLILRKLDNLKKQIILNISRQLGRAVFQLSLQDESPN